jgi:hypothetical protein
MYAEEDNWSQSGSTPVPKSVESPYEREGDVWADDYEPQELKIPEPQKITEYERESDF